MRMFFVILSFFRFSFFVPRGGSEESGDRKVFLVFSVLYYNTSVELLQRRENGK